MTHDPNSIVGAAQANARHSQCESKHKSRWVPEIAAAADDIRKAAVAAAEKHDLSLNGVLIAMAMVAGELAPKKPQ